MATISLKACISRVDTLLTVGKLDEVVHQCRHILVNYPRNLEASHMLGQALVQMGGNSSEAQALLRRVLAITPDDAASHAAISEVLEQGGQHAEATWHLERACEHATENRSYRERLRNLYRMQHGAGAELPEGLPGSVARRQIREGQRVQAIRTLKQALQKESGRQDLRLLLARTQWDAEKRLDAAENALDTLEALPWCLHANRIVASLWLTELRPSDARPFLERIHDVDPYLSLRLVSNSPPDEHTWTLAELDYRQVSQDQSPSRPAPSTVRTGATDSGWQRRRGGDPADVTDGSLPDWLQQDVTAPPAPDELAWLEGDAPAAATGVEDGVLPWESGGTGAPPAAVQAETRPEAGDELDWLNPSEQFANWFPESAPAASPTGRQGAQTPPSAGPVQAGADAGDHWRDALRGLSPRTSESSPRQQQFVFSRLPLWLRVPAGGMPSLRRTQGQGGNTG